MQTNLRGKLPKRSLAYARIRALFSRHPLPPGKLVRLDELERSNRCILLDQAAQVGPVFKAVAWGDLWIYVVGLPLARRLLRDHGEHLRPVTLKLEPLFPKGFLRQMRGEDHLHYRKALMRGIRGEGLAANHAHLEAIAADGLAGYAAGTRDDEDAAADYIRALNAIASGMLIQLSFGAQFGTEPFERIRQGYHQLGPYGLVWNLGPKQHEAFAAIRDFLLAQYSGPSDRWPAGFENSILGQLRQAGAVDATMLGNLIYMVEMGRYDTYSLFRWLTKYATDHPDLLALIATEAPTAPAGPRSLAEAFVLETLRLDQSERLLRLTLRDFVFEGHLFPKHAHVRVCLWESHKSPEAFPDPFRFDPKRFLGATPGGDLFAPFGLDVHQCPFGDIAIRTAVIFLRALARGYLPMPTGDGLPVRGMYHWEPASSFGVRLIPR